MEGVAIMNALCVLCISVIVVVVIFVCVVVILIIVTIILCSARRFHRLPAILCTDLVERTFRSYLNWATL